MTRHSEFVVQVSGLTRAVGTRRHEVRSGRIPGLEGIGAKVPPQAEIVVDVILEAVIGGVSVAGTVKAPWAGECRRCLSPAGGVLELAVRELYAPGGDCDETYPLFDDVVDLELMAHDAVLLDLPVAPLCRESCAGLCPRCGEDLNQGPCGCVAERDPRFAALDVLRSPGEPPPHPSSGPV
ncbi:MAG: YceD family protein [Acidimicrobiales bacterium]